jgi:lipoyl(octanoyl) transferase
VPTVCRWAYLGRVDYDLAIGWQRALLEARSRDAVADTLLLVEHPPVITLGRRASYGDVLADPAVLSERGIAVRETNRGGLVTYHGPGQLVGYPIAALRGLTGGDVVRYITGLEETIIRALATYGVTAGRDPRHRGVWASEAKIAAVGVAISRGVTMHGLALNVCPHLAHFLLINPCGILDRGVTSLAALGRPVVPMETIASALAAAFGAVFDRDMLHVEPAVLRAELRRRALAAAS